MRRSLLALAVGVQLALASLVALAPSMALAAAPECRVENLSSHQAFDSKGWQTPLQDAVDAATSGSTVVVMGHCHGSVAVSKSLTIVGKPLKKEPTPTLDADRCGSVVAVSSARVTLTGLTIVNGQSDCGNTPAGGGVLNQQGTVTIVDSTLTNNRAAGVINLDGDVTIVGSHIVPNFGFTGGGGIATSGGSLTVRSSVIERNSAIVGAGVFADGPAVSIASSVIRLNAAQDRGGGVATTGPVTLAGTSVTSNSAGIGGGIWSAGSVALTGSTSIGSNTARIAGGGMATTNFNVSLIGWTGSIAGNSPDDCDPGWTIGTVTCD